MGCDIHMFIEYKIGNKPWEADKHHEIINENEEDEFSYKSVTRVSAVDRNYYMFGLLAGVRAYGPEAKGLPDNLSETLAKASEYYGDDGHSHSYSSLKEFEVALKTCRVGQNGWDRQTNTATLPPNKEEVDEILRMAKPIAFFDYVSERYGYENLLAYCKHQIQLKKTELEVEKHLLGVKGSTNVECRLVYFFDN